MIVAHLPAGYLLGRALGVRSGAVMAAALAGAMLPDLDMIWFHAVDGGRVHHHHYWPHLPAVWAGLAAITLPAALLLRPGAVRPAAVFFASILLHLLLDSIAGGIAWAWPADDRLMALVEVPATRSHWILSFMVHWTFALELAIVFAAAALLLTARKHPR